MANFKRRAKRYLESRDLGNLGVNLAGTTLTAAVTVTGLGLLASGAILPAAAMASIPAGYVAAKAIQRGERYIKTHRKKRR